jgi:phage shock protein A
MAGTTPELTDLILIVECIVGVNETVKKLESQLSLIQLSIAASSAALVTLNDKVNELHQRVQDMEARLS